MILNIFKIDFIKNSKNIFFKNIKKVIFKY